MGDRTGLSISITSGLLLVYVVFASLPFSFALVFALFLSTSISLAWMVYAILTDTRDPVSKTFDEQFYLDRPEERAKE